MCIRDRLKEDKPVYAVIKATEVMVAAEPVRISARNQLPGRIVDLLEGTVCLLYTSRCV